MFLRLNDSPAGKNSRPLNHISDSVNMNRKIEAYGVKAVKRPKIQAVKFLDLSGISGQQIVKSETKLVLRTHKQTFKKLADM